MPFQTIQILRQSIMREPVRDEIDADVEGCWAIHPALPVQLNRFSLTHVPTGYQVLATQHEIAARAARAELLASGLDWSFTDPHAVTSAHKIVGKRVREKYENR